MVMSDHPAAIPFCIQCEYNLTGLTGDVCPECGWQIDWVLAALDEEGRRPGTPAHNARGWQLITGTLRTVLLMLFKPWCFARRLRHDESLKPALWTALVSFAIFIGIGNEGLPGLDHFEDFSIVVLAYTLTIAAVILCQSLFFATLNYDRRLHRRARWGSRFRMWLNVSLYSTCFVASWPLLESSPFADLSGANFYIPFLDRARGYFGGSSPVGVTIVTYWWWIILAVMLVVRNRPRWLAVASIPLVYSFVVLGTYVGFLAGNAMILLL